MIVPVHPLTETASACWPCSAASRQCHRRHRQGWCIGPGRQADTTPLPPPYGPQPGLSPIHIDK